ncbi:MAG: alpha-ketoglutarate-dependent dioxygenase AlkB family protein [Gammaproteobacteria bacterium]
MSCMPGPEFRVIDGFYDTSDSDALYRRLLHEQNWPDNRYTVAGRRFVLPRLQTWHADPGIVYSYSNNLLQTRTWTPLLNAIKVKVEAQLNYSFNSVLVNLYRNGEDYVGWHADDEPELGRQPFIASVTFGAEREFAFRHKRTSEHGSIILRNGTLLVMEPEFQHQWLHSIPLNHLINQGRINLTFRKVILRNDNIP